MLYKETVIWRGVPRQEDAIRADGKVFLIRGHLLRTATLKDIWRDDIGDAESAVAALKRSGTRIDLLKFWQRVPDSDVRYPFYREWRDVAALRVRSFEHWWAKQISGKTRNMVRKAEKLGVVCREVVFDDEFVRGIQAICNETPVKRGKPFWHYRKPFDVLKQQMSADLEQAVFVGAYCESELIGFIKLLITERYAMVTVILDKMSQRQKAPINALFAKAVAICAAQGVPYITYTVWRRAEHGQFQERNGFERIRVPEYYVPLSTQGALALRLRLHEGIKGALPENVYSSLLRLRARWYSWRHAAQGV